MAGKKRKSSNKNSANENKRQNTTPSSSNKNSFFKLQPTPNYEVTQPPEKGFGSFAPLPTDIIKYNLCQYLERKDTLQLFKLSKSFHGLMYSNVDFLIKTTISTKPNFSPKELEVNITTKSSKQNKTEIDHRAYYNIASLNMSKLLKGNLTALIPLAACNCDSLLKSDPEVITEIQKCMANQNLNGICILFSKPLVTAIINQSKEMFDWLIATIKSLEIGMQKEIFPAVISSTISIILLNLEEKDMKLNSEQQTNLEFLLSSFKETDLVYFYKTTLYKHLLASLPATSLPQSSILIDIFSISASEVAKHLKLEVTFVEENINNNIKTN